MRISHCESYCAPPLCYLSCLPKSKDARSDAVSAAPSQAGAAAAATTEDKPPPVQKIEVAVADDDDGVKEEKMSAVSVAGNNDDDKEEEKTVVVAAAVVAPKSSLKKANCPYSKDVTKGNVKWLDLLGKDLAEIKEFEPSESGDSQDDGDGTSACICVIQ